MPSDLSVQVTEKLLKEPEVPRNHQVTEKTEETSETNDKETNTSLTSESPGLGDNVANLPEFNTSHTSSTASITTLNANEENMTEVKLSLINERKYEIKDNILSFLKYVLWSIIVHNILGIVLTIAFLLFRNFMYAFFTFLAIMTPILILPCIIYTWEKITDENANLFRNILYEITRYKYYKEYKDCYNIIQIYKLDNNVETYKNAIRKIEDLRYFTLTNAMFYSSTQLFAQFIILIYFFNLYTLALQIGLILFSLILKILCIIIFRCSFCDFKNDLGIYRVSIFIYFVTLMSMFLYLSDILTDFVITIKYLCFQHYIRGTLTFLFIIIPGIYNTWHEYFRQKLAFKVKKTKILPMLLNLNPVLGYWKSIQLLNQTRKFEMNNNEDDKKTTYLEYVKNNLIVASSRYNECFTESCSQMIIQLSFLLLTVDFSQLMDEKMHIINIISSIVSVLNVAVSLVLFFRSKRVKQYEEDSLPIQGMIIQFLGYIPIASRIISLSFVASQHPYLTFLAMFWHWFIIMIWMACATKQTKLPQLLNNGIIAIVHTYTPPINSYRIEIIFQVIFFVENVAAMLFWNLSKFKMVTLSGILIIICTVVVPSLIGCICRYFYRKYYNNWIAEFEESRNKRLNLIL